MRAGPAAERDENFRGTDDHLRPARDESHGLRVQWVTVNCAEFRTIGQHPHRVTQWVTRQALADAAERPAPRLNFTELDYRRIRGTIVPGTMKTLAVFVIAIPCFGFGAEVASLPTFAPRKIEVPQLSLTESVKQGQLVPPDPGVQTIAAGFRIRASEARQKMVSNMPVLVPKPGVDENMPIVRADASKDFKMIVREPQIEIAK